VYFESPEIVVGDVGGEIDCEVVSERWVSIDMRMSGKERNAMIEM